MSFYRDNQQVVYYYKEEYGYWIVGDNETNATPDPKTITNLKIPKTINGCDIEEIGAYSFLRCVNLKIVTINAMIKQINQGAFYECWNLTSINIPSSCTFLGRGAISCVIFEEPSKQGITAPGTLAVKFEPNSSVTRIEKYGIERKENIIITYCGYKSPSVEIDGLFYMTDYRVVFSPVEIYWGNITSIIDPSICLLIQEAKEKECRTLSFKGNFLYAIFGTCFTNVYLNN